MIFTKKNPYGFLSYPSRKFYTFFHVGLIKFCLGIVEGRIYKMVPTPKMYPALIPGIGEYDKYHPCDWIICHSWP